MSLPLRFSLLLLATLASCASGLPRPDGVPKSYDTVEVPGAIDAARDALLHTDGASAAVAYLAAAQAAPQLTTEQSATIQTLLVDAVSKRLDELRGGGDPEELEAIGELELPRDLAVRASMAAARALLDQENEWPATSTWSRWTKATPCTQDVRNPGDCCSKRDIPWP